MKKQKKIAGSRGTGMAPSLRARCWSRAQSSAPCGWWFIGVQSQEINTAQQGNYGEFNVFWVFLSFFSVGVSQRGARGWDAHDWPTASAERTAWDASLWKNSWKNLVEALGAFSRDFYPCSKWGLGQSTSATKSFGTKSFLLSNSHHLMCTRTLAV